MLRFRTGMTADLPVHLARHTLAPAMALMPPRPAADVTSRQNSDRLIFAHADVLRHYRVDRHSR